MTTPYSETLLQQLRARFAAEAQLLLINGKWQAARSGETFDIINPADGQVFARAASGEAADVELAVTAARRAFDEGPWPSLPPAQRARLLLKLADLIEANAEELALTESLDNGMPFMMARFGALGAAENLRYNAGWATKLGGETITPSLPGEWHAFTLREPVGVVGAIVPWNFPFLMAVGKIAPALAVGCTVVLKPAEQAPLTAVRLGALLLEAGFPPGVVNIVTGFGRTAGAALVAHAGVDKISFTGSTAVGKSIISVCGGDLKRVTLELGGKSPVLIFPDADLDRAIPSAATGIFGNAGQVCAAGSRLFVHTKVAEQVVEGICARARSLRVGPGLAPGTEMGPLVSQVQLARVLGYIESGANEGATIVAGGNQIQGAGYFVQPTVLINATAKMRTVREEIFGPVLSVMIFGDEDLASVVAAANDSDYGLAASIWTRDINTAHKVARRIKAGSIRINGPGSVDAALPLGGYKQSGWGRENGRAGIEAFTELKSVAIAL